MAISDSQGSKPGTDLPGKQTSVVPTPSEPQRSQKLPKPPKPTADVGIYFGRDNQPRLMGFERTPAGEAGEARAAARARGAAVAARSARALGLRRARSRRSERPSLASTSCAGGVGAKCNSR